MKISPKPKRYLKGSLLTLLALMLLGTAALLDGLIERFEQEMGPAKTLVATGGAASTVLPHCLRKIHFCDTLLLDGLLLAYRASS